MKKRDYFENPLSETSLAAETERGFDEIERLPSRLERYAEAHARALVNLAQVRDFIESEPDSMFSHHLRKVRQNIATCGDYLGFKHYYTVGKVRLTAACFCKVHLLCPLCAIRRGSKTLQAYTQRHSIIMAENPGLKMSMLTLTVKNGDDLSERFEHLKKAVSVLLERRRKTLAGAKSYHSEGAKILGLVGSFEVTNKGNGWHPHCHLMILHNERINAATLKREWLAITGDSKVLRIDPARNPDDPVQDFHEIFKYALKFSDLTPEQNLHAYSVLRGKRLLISAGLFWGVEVPESMLDDELEGLPYFDMLYNYVVGSGYNWVSKAEFLGSRQWHAKTA